MYSCYSHVVQSFNNFLRDLYLLSTTVQNVYCTGGIVVNITCGSQADQDDECPPHSVLKTATTGSAADKKRNMVRL